MDKAKWREVLYIANEVCLDYNAEKQIRKASGRRELRCIDPDCNNPIVKYCHGEKKSPYFAHINKSLCEYEEFDRENTSIIKIIKLKLFDIIKNNGFNVQLDVKLIPHHYTHLLVSNQEKKLAIELVNRNISANRIDFLASNYKNNNINVKFVVINELEDPICENELAFVKRFIVNEVDKNDVLEIELNGKSVKQYIIDSNKYQYNGREISSKNYPQIYQMNGNICNITIENDTLTLKSFFEDYDSWLAKKKSAFEKKIIAMQNEEKRLAEERAKREEIARRMQENEIKRKDEELKSLREKHMLELEKKNTEIKNKNDNKNHRTQFDTLLVKKSNETSKTDQECLIEIKDRLSSGEEKVFDCYGRQWLKCKCCRRIMQKDAFAKLGTPGEYNLGICWKCNNGF